MTRVLCLALLATGLALPSRAATLQGYSLPDTYTVDGQTLKLNGIGLRTLTVLRVKVYLAGLYLAAPGHDAKAILNSGTPKVILMQFLHAGSKADVEKQFREGERKNCGNGGCDPGDEADFDKLVAATPAVKVGDTFTYFFTSGRVRVFFNNQVIGDFANKDLAYHLLDGFIGASPPSTDLREALLGEGPS